VSFAVVFPNCCSLLQSLADPTRHSYADTYRKYSIITNRITSFATKSIAVAVAVAVETHVPAVAPEAHVPAVGLYVITYTLNCNTIFTCTFPHLTEFPKLVCAVTFLLPRSVVYRCCSSPQ